MVALGQKAVSYERGTPVPRRDAGDARRFIERLSSLRPSAAAIPPRFATCHPQGVIEGEGVAERGCEIEREREKEIERERERESIKAMQFLREKSQLLEAVCCRYSSKVRNLQRISEVMPGLTDLNLFNCISRRFPSSPRTAECRQRSRSQRA